jgi:hypothetical protein
MSESNGADDTTHWSNRSMQSGCDGCEASRHPANPSATRLKNGKYFNFVGIFGLKLQKLHCKDNS